MQTKEENTNAQESDWFYTPTIGFCSTLQSGANRTEGLNISEIFICIWKKQMYRSNPRPNKILKCI